MSQNPDDFIRIAIDSGSRHGLASLSALQKTIFLISEVEVYSDMGGIDSFVDAHGQDGLVAAAEAFLAVGATEISADLVRMAREWPSVDEDLWNHANDLVTSRSGYGYESIAALIEHRLRLGA